MSKVNGKVAVRTQWATKRRSGEINKQTTHMRLFFLGTWPTRLRSSHQHFHRAFQLKKGLLIITLRGRKSKQCSERICQGAWCGPGGAGEASLRKWRRGLSLNMESSLSKSRMAWLHNFQKVTTSQRCLAISRNQVPGLHREGILV